jgi:hypothetical protein
MTNPVMQALVNAKMREASVFGKWCILKGVPALPASPAAVAAFVRDCEPLIPVDKIWEAVSEVSQSHLSNGLADPTAGGQVASAMSAMARIDPPRSWPDPLKTRFKSLPYDLQIYVERHEREREKAVRRAQNEAATAKRKLGELEQPAKQEPKAGNIESQPAA